jgi:O-antigen ligase
VLGLLTALACVFSSRKLILSHLTATVGIGMLIAAVLLFLFQEKVEVYRDIVVQYAFEPIVNYIQEGTFTASSTEDLLTMLYLPDRIQHFLLGVGAFDAPGHGLLQTDSGYLKTLLSSGLLGVLFTYGSFLLLFCVVVLSAHKSARFIFVIAFAGLFITEVKEPFLYQNAVSRGLWILFAAALYDHLKRGNIEKPAMCTLVNPGMSGVQK